MDDLLKIPQGDVTVTVELTVKELMALTGVRFQDNNTINSAARKKLIDALEGTYAIGSDGPLPRQLYT